MSNRRIVLGTSNRAKRAQLRWLLEGLPLQPVDPKPQAVPEDAPVLAGNAAAKALAHSANGLAIASDGGLEVPALDAAWQPMRTHRQGQARLRELTTSLADRRVAWAEAVAIAEHGQLLASWTEAGTEGLLVPEPWPAGSEFWVWDIFLFPQIGKTWAQLTPEESASTDHTWMALKRTCRSSFGGDFSSPKSAELVGPVDQFRSQLCASTEA